MCTLRRYHCSCIANAIEVSFCFLLAFALSCPRSVLVFSFAVTWALGLSSFGGLGHLGVCPFAAPSSGASRIVWSLLVGLFFASHIALAGFLIDSIVVVIWCVL